MSKRSVICNQGIACYCTCISSFSHKLNLLYCKRSADAAEQHKKVQKISEKAIMYAILNNYIKQEQYDEYVYALEIILNILITDITMIIIGLAMGMIWECILFWLVYKILRKYCGGYHFSTSLKCYLSSCIMCPVVLAVVRYVPYSMTVWGLLTLTALIILSILSPVEAANKPLDEKEQRIFGITARILIIISAVCWSVTAIVFRQLILSKIISLRITLIQKRIRVIFCQILTAGANIRPLRQKLLTSKFSCRIMQI